jgi:hypothetical protein
VTEWRVYGRWDGNGEDYNLYYTLSISDVQIHGFEFLGVFYSKQESKAVHPLLMPNNGIPRPNLMHSSQRLVKSPRSVLVYVTWFPYAAFPRGQPFGGVFPLGLFCDLNATGASAGFTETRVSGSYPKAIACRLSS